MLIVYTNISTNETYLIGTVRQFGLDPLNTFFVDTPSGKHVTPHGDPSNARSRATHTLEPQKAVRLHFVVNEIYKFDEIGTYHITVKTDVLFRYSDKRIRYIPVASNPLDVDVIPGLFTGKRSDGEFVYEGKTLLEWAEYGYTNDLWPGGPKWRAADEAVRAIGINAIPTLLSWLVTVDSPTNEVNAAIWNEAARRGFCALAEPKNETGEPQFFNLRPAATNVVNIYKRNISPSSHMAACEILEELGTAIDPAAVEIIPQLCSDATNETTLIGYHAELALSNIRSQAPVIVPFLAKLLHDSTDTNYFIQGGVVQALGNLGTNARPAIRTLIEFQNRPIKTTGLLVPQALEKIDPDGTATRAVLSRPERN